MKKTDKVAFWKHDKFPYVLWGKVVNKNDRGHVETEEYGQGYYFKPIKILEGKEASNLIYKLLSITETHKKIIASVNSEFHQSLKEIVPWTMNS